MQILKLKPAFKDYIWGGEKLKTEYKKDTTISPVAESWELSTHPDGESIIANGDFKGYSLSKFITEQGKAVLGKNCEKFEMFPILIKFIDAKQALSVQVHPSDEYALRVEKEYGKTEMWYIMDCEPGSFLYYGVNKSLSKAQFAKAIQDETICDDLCKVEVQKGDVFFIPAGTIHAIGAGIMICEIQQNSNTTYRVFDYGRRDANGNPRDLHIDKAIEVTKLVPSTIGSAGGVKTCPDNTSHQLLASCEYFTTELIKSGESCALNADNQSFISVTVLEGSGRIGDVDFVSGDSFFVPAGYGNFVINGECSFIKTTV